MSETGGTTRRGLAGGIVLGAAAVAAAGAAMAKTFKPGAPVSDQSKDFPKPPYAEQRQPWPALQSKMTPRPDCGETSYKGSGKMAGRRALITGGDSGIGRAVAIAFAREGADVAINYYPSEEPDAQEVVALIRAAGRKAVAIPVDIRTEANCRRIVDRAAEGLGGLDVLVNNAAYQQSRKTIADITDEQMVRTFETNIFAMFRLSKAALERMGPGATIVNTASENSYDPGEELLDYASTKGAILIFTKGLAKQMASRGIRVNAVAPGPFWTPLQVAGGQLPGTMAEFGTENPLGRSGQPVELAPLYVTLAGHEATFCTGQCFGASGGVRGP